MIDARMNALLVMKAGEIVTEIYRHGSDDSTRFTAMSMSKSFLSALYGVALEDGMVQSVDEPITRYLWLRAGRLDRTAQR
jgi:CubicO group peptidase (beta-lactamase class C family)